MIRAICTAMRFPAGGFMSAVVAPLAADNGMRTVGPFTTVGHALPTSLAPGALALGDDVRPHPHIGIATLSYLFEGAVTHRDTLGVTQEIKPGAVNWMVAGSGVVHSERYETIRRDGGNYHGLQIWMALPNEEAAPSFQHFAAEQMPRFDAKGVSGRLIAGAADGLAALANMDFPFYMQDVRLDAGATLAAPSGFEERAFYVVSGAVDCAEQTIEAGQTILLTAGGAPFVTATAPAHVLSFGGAPIGKRYLWWNFVSSDLDRLEAAKVAWREGRFGLPAEDAADFTPLPADHERPLMTLNP